MLDYLTYISIWCGYIQSQSTGREYLHETIAIKCRQLSKSQTLSAQKQILNKTNIIGWAAWPGEVGDGWVEVSGGPADGFLPDPPAPRLGVARPPGEDVLVAGVWPGGGAPGKVGGEAAPPGSQVRLQAEAGACGRVFLAPGGAAGQGRHGAPLDPRQVRLLRLGQTATPHRTRSFQKAESFAIEE